MNTNHPLPSPDPATVNAGVIAAVRSHRIKLRVLSTAAFLFGFLALITGFLIAWCYPYFILPKQRQLTEDAAVLVQQYKTNAAASQAVGDAAKQMGELLSNQILVTNVATLGTVVVALAVGVLGLGTLILLTVVIVNRRVALNQINASLTRISNQLCELQNTRGSP